MRLDGRSADDPPGSPLIRSTVGGWVAREPVQVALLCLDEPPMTCSSVLVQQIEKIESLD